MANLRAFQYAKRNKQLKKLGFKSYKEFLNSREWKNAKIEIQKRIEEDHKKGKVSRWERCDICGCTKGLQMHHIKYGRILPIQFSRIFMMCGDCHEAIHKYNNSRPDLSIKKCTRIVRRFYQENGFLPL